MGWTWTWHVSPAQLVHLGRGGTYTHHQHGLALSAKIDDNGLSITITVTPDSLREEKGPGE